ncbi:MAG: cation:proton antiporter [Verrucomicrobia bacterium]|nr:cation:proton antiporter [Verrucomicrobiota bacterium]
MLAVITGSFSLPQAGGHFVIMSLGGIAIGLLVGWLAEQFHKHVDDAPIEVTVSLLTPFVAYLLAEKLDLSGVLAVVIAGLYLGWRMPELLNFKTRLQGGPVWEMVEFLLNGFVFILIGLQLPEVIEALSAQAIPTYRLILYALTTSLAVILVRFLWVFPAIYLPHWFLQSHSKHNPLPRWRHVMIIAWTGMRGVLSLAAALALPITRQDGTPFPGRDLILFLTFTVIIVTLVMQGLSLPPLIRWLGVKEDSSSAVEERKARLKANQEAFASLNEIDEKDPAKADALQRLRMEYEDHIRQVEGAASANAGTPLRRFSTEYEHLSLASLLQERQTILHLRNENVISDEVLRRIQLDIDLAEARLGHHQ